MFDPKFFDELSKRLAECVPENIKGLRNDMESHFKQILQMMFAKLDLVTREEFDIQAMVLSKTRAKLEKLITQVSELEKKAAAKKKAK